MVKTLLAPLVLGLVLLLIALGVRSGRFARSDPGEPLNAAARAAREGPTLSSDDARAIAAQFGTPHVLPSGLRYLVRAPGEGAVPVPGDVVVVHYDARLLSGGRFDSTRDRGRPEEVRVGTGELLRGLDETLLLMRPGERRTVIVPWWLGYGERGRAPLVPARATLVYELELIAVR